MTTSEAGFPVDHGLPRSRPVFLNHSPNAAVLKRWERRSTFNSLRGQYLGVKIRKMFSDLVLPEFSAASRVGTRHLVEVWKR